MKIGWERMEAMRDRDGQAGAGQGCREAVKTVKRLFEAFLGWKERTGPQNAEPAEAEPGRGFSSPENARDAAIKIAVEAWRFGRVFEKMADKLEEAERERCMSQLSSFYKKIENSLDALGLRMVSIEGTPFEPGIAAIPSNIEDFGPGDELTVDRMIEPIIMGEYGLIRAGRVTLRKMER